MNLCCTFFIWKKGRLPLKRKSKACYLTTATARKVPIPLSRGLTSSVVLVPQSLKNYHQPSKNKLQTAPRAVEAAYFLSFALPLGSDIWNPQGWSSSNFQKIAHPSWCGLCPFIAQTSPIFCSFHLLSFSLNTLEPFYQKSIGEQGMGWFLC